MKAIAPDGEAVDLMTLNLGPSHPATHGTLRVFTALDGENVVAAVSEMGYLHRGFEKMIEQGTYQQVLPYTDRLNYCSAMINNIAFCKAAEKMFDVTVPERCVTLCASAPTWSTLARSPTSGTSSTSAKRSTSSGRSSAARG
jgi:NADH-quinone oxidoreductase subunit D/NADH-quinone oxidoreductase subunit C/D